jgi:hypothetical protein
MKAMDLVKEYLADQGYRYEIDSDGDLHFRAEGVNLYCTDSGDDEQYFRIIMPNIYTIENNREKVLEAVNRLSREYKVLKAFVTPQDNLWLSIEMFIDSSPEVEDFFPRCMRLMKMAREKMANEIFD